MAETSGQDWEKGSLLPGNFDQNVTGSSPRIISVAQTDPQLRGWDHGTRERIFAWTVAWLKESRSETLTIFKHQLFAHHVRCQT